MAEVREVRKWEFRKVCRKQTKVFAKLQRSISFGTIGSGRRCCRDPCILAKVKERTPEELREREDSQILPQSLIMGRAWTVDLVLENSSIKKSGKREKEIRECFEV